MIRKIRELAKKHLVNIRGWRTNRKIVVFESDDWGAIRMSSKKNLEKLADLGLKVKKCHYVQNDALASEEDLNRLFDLLTTYKDYKGNYPIITLNTIMANPDFRKIKESGFKEYHYETFIESLTRYPKHKNCFEIWKDGISNGLIYPQFHGREHLQVKRWMNYLRNPESETRKAFELGVFGLSTTVTSEKRKSFMASYDWDDEESRDFILKSISNGLTLFSSIFGFNSLSSIAPNYVWHHDVEEVLRTHGVNYIQGSRVQKSPLSNTKDFKKVHHYTGQRNQLGQFYLVRNCKFEPSSRPDFNWVDKCINDIHNAFFWKKPAIIEMHRVNFIGFIDPENRQRNLKLFESLLEKISHMWPEVEFMTSEQLGKLIENYD